MNLGQRSRSQKIPKVSKKSYLLTWGRTLKIRTCVISNQIASIFCGMIHSQNILRHTKFCLDSSTIVTSRIFFNFAWEIAFKNLKNSIKSSFYYFTTKLTGLTENNNIYIVTNFRTLPVDILGLTDKNVPKVGHLWRRLLPSICQISLWNLMCKKFKLRPLTYIRCFVCETSGSKDR